MTETTEQEIADLRQRLTGKRILVAVLSDVAHASRANRLIRFLQSIDCELHVLSGDESLLQCHHHRIEAKRGRVKQAVCLAQLLAARFESYLGGRWCIDIPSGDFHTVICHDLLLLPMLKKQVSYQRLIVDLREFYPLQFEHQWWWRLTFGKLSHYLCQNYLSNEDANRTVSWGLRDLYTDSYGIDTAIAPSYAEFHDLSPAPVDQDSIKLVHHGNATANRRIEDMIEMMAYLDHSYTLDFYLVDKDARYLESLKRLAADDGRIIFQPPIQYQDIVPVLNGYDVGLCFFPETTTNLKHSLPNKFFEFSQARLAVLCSPLAEMRRRAAWDSSIRVAALATPEAYADCVRELRAEDIGELKTQSGHRAITENANVFCCLMLSERWIKEGPNPGDCDAR